MALEFSLEQASIVGWLTRRDFPPPVDESDWGRWPERWYFRRRRLDRSVDQGEDSGSQAWRAPRVQMRVLSGFLEALPDSVVTSRQEDHAILGELASKARSAFSSFERSAEDSETVLDSAEVARILAPLRRWFDVPFYFMPLLGSQVELERFRDSTDYTMWLQCRDDRSKARDLLDPFPPLRQLFTASKFEPATVCWTWGGETVVIPTEGGPIGKLLEMVQSIPPGSLWSELKRLGKTQAPAFNLLQLSDLHFGAGRVTSRNLAYVEQHLRGRIDDIRRAGGVVQPVITGDLMDTPSKENLEEFDAFRNRLH
jgi:hypothetical protein